MKMSMVDLQPTACGVDSRPNVLVCQPLVHYPGLVQQCDLALGADQTQKIHPTRHQRQFAGQQRDLHRRQLSPCDLLLRSAWCRPL